MPKRKQKKAIEKFLRTASGRAKRVRKLPKYMVLPVFIAGLSVIVLVVASVQALTPGRACVNAPASPYPSMDVIVQKGSVRTEKTITNRHIISCLSDDLRHLPEYPATPLICPQSDGSTYILNFDGGRIVTGSLSGCQAVKIQDNSKIYYLLPDTPYAKDYRSKLQKILQ
jgi:hypothetical protein